MVEDKIHFVLVCPAYRIPRSIMLNKIIETDEGFIEIDDDTGRFKYLMINKWKELINHVSDAWQLRKKALYRA